MVTLQDTVVADDWEYEAQATEAETVDSMFFYFLVLSS